MCCFEDNEDYVIEKISINLPRNMVSPTVGSEGYADAVANDIEYITECLVWESSNEDVITVTQDGKLTAVGGGTAVISVYSRRNPSVYGYATITVEEEEVEVSRITLSCSTSTTLSVGDKGTATATVYPSNATDKTVTFRSTNTSVMSCTSGGNYTARTPGTASIVATASNEVTASKTFTVKVEPTGIIVDSHCICLRPGCEYYLNASVIPSTAPRGIRYTSMNDSIADVGSDGRICAHDYGQTRIKVMASSKTSVYTYVTVYVSDCGCNCDDCEDTVCASSVIFTGTPKRQILVGETGYITSYVCPSNAVNKTVTYSSNNRSVLSCASNGYYEAKAAGSATVTARTSNGVIATKTYTVKDVPAGINVERTCVCLSPGCEYYLNASVVPSTAPQGIEYESMNEGIVIFDMNY